MKNEKILETEDSLNNIMGTNEKILETGEITADIKNKKYEIDEELKEILRDKPEENEILSINHNFIISQNKVIFVNDINKEEIKAGGKLSTGINYKTGESVRILDKDYGKSTELLRLLLEGENKTNYKRILLYTGIGIFSLIILIIIFSLINSKTTESEKTSNGFIPTINTIQTSSGTQNKSIDIDMTSNKINPKNNLSNDEISEGGSFNTQTGQSLNDGQFDNKMASNSYPYLQNQNQSINNSQNNISAQITCLDKDYELEIAKLENKKNQNTNEDITKDNEKLKALLLENDKKIDYLTEQLKKYTDIPKNLTQEAFLLHLGTKIYEKCQKTLNIEEQNNCKDLYFDYVNKK